MLEHNEAIALELIIRFKYNRVNGVYEHKDMLLCRPNLDRKSAKITMAAGAGSSDCTLFCVRADPTGIDRFIIR